MNQKPSTDIIKLDQVRTDINKIGYEQAVNHPFITGQFKNFFDNPKMAQEKLDTFRANYIICISDPDIKTVIANADKFTVIQSLINLTKDNLSINPYDKEACIVKYGNKVVGMPMAKGKIKRMQEKGAIRYIECLEVVYNYDKITNKNGRYTLTKEIINVPKDGKRVGVLLIAIMTDGKERHKFVMAKDVLLRKEHAPSKAIWTKWEDEMWRKTAINIFEKEIGVATLQFSEEYEDETPVEQVTEEATYEEVQEEAQQEEAVVVEQEPAQAEEPDILSEISEALTKKKEELTSKISANPGILKSDEIDKLKGIFQTIDIEKCQGYIDAINARIEKKKAEKEKLRNSPDAPKI